MNIFKKDFWVMVKNSFVERASSPSLFAIPSLVLSLLVSFPFLLIFSILNLMGVMPDA